LCSLKFPELHSSSKLDDLQDLRSLGLSKRSFKVFSVTVSSLSSTSEASNYIPAAPIFLPEGPWQQVSLAHYLFQGSRFYCLTVILYFLVFK